MSDIDERPWRSYLKAREARRKYRSLSLAEKEEMYRKNIRKQSRQMYERYPMVAYTNLVQDDSIYSSELKAEHKKRRKEVKMKIQKRRRKEKEMVEEWQARFLQNSDDVQRARYLEIFEGMRKQQEETRVEGELYQRIYREELERLKTLPPVRRSPVRELIEYIKFKILLFGTLAGIMGRSLSNSILKTLVNGTGATNLLLLFGTLVSITEVMMSRVVLLFVLSAISTRVLVFVFHSFNRIVS